MMDLKHTMWQSWLKNQTMKVNITAKKKNLKKILYQPMPMLDSRRPKAVWLDIIDDLT